MIECTEIIDHNEEEKTIKKVKEFIFLLINHKLNTVTKKYTYNDNNGMTIYGMLKYIYENPGSKVTHRLFLSGEYIFYDENTDSIRDEENNLFEDWRETDYSYNGILTRCTPVWQDGWSLYDINITH